MTKALITGVESEDGAYLARLLDARGYELRGIAGSASGLGRLDDLGVRDKIDLVSAATALDVAPDEIYDLADDFELTAALLDGIAPGAIRLFHAAVGTIGASPATAAVREARGRGVFAATGFLFDRASRLSDPSHPALRLVTAARDAAIGDAPLVLETPDAARDLGWSPEYVDAMGRMLRAATPADHVIATGLALSDRDIARHALDYFRGDPMRIVEGDRSAPPPVLGDPGPALRDLGWRAYTHGRDLVRALCEGIAAT